MAIKSDSQKRWQAEMKAAWEKAGQASTSPQFEQALLELDATLDRVSSDTKEWDTDCESVAKWALEESTERSGLSKALGRLIHALGMARAAHYAEALRQLKALAQTSRKASKANGQCWACLYALSVCELGLVHYRLGDARSALPLYQQAINLARKANSLQVEARAYHYSGMVRYPATQREQAMRSLKQALSLYERTNNEVGIAQVYDTIGVIRFDQGQFEEAERLYEQSLIIKTRLNDRRGQEITYSNLGKLYAYRQEYERALYFFNESLRIAEAMGDFYGLMVVHNNIGDVYLEQGRAREALVSFQTSLRLARSTNNQRGEGYAQYYMSKAYCELGDYESSRRCCAEAAAIFENVEDLAARAMVESQYGVIQSNLKNYGLAEDHFQKAIRTLRELELPSFLSEALYEYGMMLRWKGDEIEAIPYFTEAVHVSEKLQAEKLVQRFKSAIAHVDGQQWAEALLRLKEQHDELEQSHERIKELEDLRDALTYMIIHDMKNPLTPIQCGIKTVLSIPEVPPVVDELLENASRECDRLLGMIDDISEVGKMSSGEIKLELSEVDLHSLVEEACQMMSVAAEDSGMNLVNRVPANLPLVHLDRKLIFRVLANLISNALRYGRPTKLSRSKPAVIIRARQEDRSALVISVRDQGEGIPREEQARIFDPYYQAKKWSQRERRAGVGLGLTFCQLAVEAHGGSIWVESEEGKGNVFSFRLPIQ